MRGIALSLLRLLTRVIVALAIALVLGLLLTLFREGGSFARDFGVACLVVGCLFLLLAPAGRSPAMRGGTIDTWTASFFPRLVPAMTEEYSGTTLTTSAVFALTGIVLLALGAVLAS